MSSGSNGMVHREKVAAGRLRMDTGTLTPIVAAAVLAIYAALRMRWD